MSHIRRAAFIALIVSLLFTGLSLMIHRGEARPTICLIEDCAVTSQYGFPMVALGVDRYEGLNCGSIENPRRTDSRCGSDRYVDPLGLFVNFLFYFAIAFGAVCAGSSAIKSRTS